MGHCVGSGEITKIQINLELIKIIQFCLKIYDLWKHPHLWVGGWVGQWVRSGQITKNQRNLIEILLKLIEIIQFCLKIYDLWRHPHLSVGVWVVG